MYVAALAALAFLVLVGCGLPIPTEGATGCGRNVYVEQGAPLECVHALEMVGKAESFSGVGLRNTTIEFLKGDSVAEFGHPESLGYTEGSAVVVPWDAGFSLVHEAFHVRDGVGHCNWSSPDRLAVFNAAQVDGEFYDECAHVTCGASWAYRNVVGQLHGGDYSCN